MIVAGAFSSSLKVDQTSIIIIDDDANDFTCMKACFDIIEMQTYPHLELLHEADYILPTFLWLLYFLWWLRDLSGFPTRVETMNIVSSSSTMISDNNRQMIYINSLRKQLLKSALFYVLGLLCVITQYLPDYNVKELR